MTYDDIISHLSDVYLFDSTEVKKACISLAEAFSRYEFIMKIISNGNKRVKKMIHSFVPVVKYGLKHGIVYASSPSFEGVAVWLPSEKYHMSNINVIRYGGIGAGFHLSPKEILKFAKVDTEVLKLHKEVISEPHWYLATLGVDPKYQGQGFSRKLLDPMLKYLDQTGLPAFLETNSVKNTQIYQKFGFTIARKERLHSVDIDQWSMLKTPTN